MKKNKNRFYENKPHLVKNPFKLEGEQDHWSCTGCKIFSYGKTNREAWDKWFKILMNRQV